MIPQLRASFTTLSLWKSGRYEDAVKAHFHVGQTLSTKAMAQGKNWHDEWERFILTNKRLPDVFGGYILQNPEIELKREIRLDEWLVLVIKPDCVDSPTIYEFKTGITESNEYLSSMQLGVYGVGLLLEKIRIDRAVVYHYNPHNTLSNMSIRYFDEKLLRKSYAWIKDSSSEMYKYLLENDLYNKLHTE